MLVVNLLSKFRQQIFLQVNKRSFLQKSFRKIIWTQAKVKSIRADLNTLLLFKQRFLEANHKTKNIYIKLIQVSLSFRLIIFIYLHRFNMFSLMSSFSMCDA